jgi:tRNA-2-methylthio-N6-dimethylallyladenosine synthase
MNDIRKDSFNKKYFVRTYGCQLNENDSEKISGMLESMGYTATDEMKDADIIVFNTCTIRENANDKIFGNLGIVNHIKKKDPDKVLVLCGCMMKEDHNKQKVLSKYKFVDIIFGPADIHKFPCLWTAGQA